MNCLYYHLNELSLPRYNLKLTVIHVAYYVLEHTRKTCRQEDEMTGFNVHVECGPIKIVWKLECTKDNDGNPRLCPDCIEKFA